MSKYSVRLNQGQRKSLEQMVKSGPAPARKIQHAQILLRTDSGPYGPRWSNKQIQQALGVGETLICTVRKRFVQEGLEAALNRKQQPERPKRRKIDGKQEAQMIALMCTEQPEGQERWTLRAIAERLVELEIVESVSHETVRTVLKKMNSNPGRRSNGVWVREAMDTSLPIWRMCSTSIPCPMIQNGQMSAWMREVSNW